jgi:integrase
MKTKRKSRPVPNAPRLHPHARLIALPEVKKAVAATHPSGSNREAVLISHLLGFLADPISGWDQKESPCIPSLLDQEKTNRHGHYLAQSQVNHGTIAARLASLRCIHRAVCPTETSRHKSREARSPGETNKGAIAALDQVGKSGVSFAEVAASWSDLISTLGIRHLNLDSAIGGFRLNLENNLKRPLPVSAREISVGTTSPEVVGKWKVFAEAIAPNLQAVISLRVDRRLVTEPNFQVLSGKRKSNAAVKREAKAKQDRRLQRTEIFDMSQVTWPQWQALDPTIRSWAASYKPELTSEEQWSILRPAYLRLMSLSRPRSTTRALNISSHLATYLKWIAERRPQAKRREVLALSEVGIRKDVDTWIATMSSGSKHSHASRRSDVRGVLNALYPESAPVRLVRQPVAGPYSVTEITQMRALARFQPTVLKSMHLSALIALCAGGGLTPSEAVHVSPSNLLPLELGGGRKTYLVQVSGAKARAVPLLLEYVDLLEEVISMHRKLNYKATRNFLPKAPSSTAHRVIVATQGEGNKPLDIQAYRLRATWLVTLMQAPVPLAQLLHAAGLVSTHNLFDLIPYCQPIDPSRIQEILATAASKKAVA